MEFLQKPYVTLTEKEAIYLYEEADKVELDLNKE